MIFSALKKRSTFVDGETTIKEQVNNSLNTIMVLAQMEVVVRLHGTLLEVLQFPYHVVKLIQELKTLMGVICHLPFNHLIQSSD